MASSVTIMTCSNGARNILWNVLFKWALSKKGREIFEKYTSNYALKAFTEIT